MVVAAHEVIVDGAGVALALEWLDWGETLANRHRRDPLGTLDATRVARKIAAALSVVHAADVVHRDLSPSNVVVDASLDRVALIDFDIASPVPVEEPAFESTRVLQGTLPYIAPEQTGRMNRAVDYRSDYYALGAIVYELLTGVTPFVSDDATEMVHAHMARRATPPHSIDPGIPASISAVVMKLLDKDADARYQSAAGIDNDLAECIEALADGRDLELFVPGTRDHSERFRLPQGMYGRDTQSARLLNRYTRAVEGSTELVLVHGDAGVGKTALVRELDRSLTRHGAHSVAGKFEQLESSLPYSGLIQALRSLVRLLAAEPQAALDRWKNTLSNALAGNAQLLIDVIPELVWILGEQPAVSVGLAEAKNAFHDTMLRFVQVLATPAHPLVLFLDDLQWADRATLAVLERLTLGAPDGQALLIIGAYRSDEVDVAHPLTMMLDEIRSAGFSWEAVPLEPLGELDTRALVGDAVHRSEGYEALAALVQRQTSGNPFYVRQFLGALARDGLLVRDRHADQWSWDEASISHRAVTENVASALERHLRSLSESTQAVLRVAACIGTEFGVQTLCGASGLTHEQIEEELVEGRRQGFITPAAGEQPGDDPLHRFVHDRVRHAAYGLLGDDAARTHLRIGRLLQSSPTASDDGVFDVVGHLNRALDDIEDPTERRRLAELNLEAGRRARRSAAYELAAGFLHNARACLPADPWQVCHGLSFSIAKELAESRYLSGAFEEARELFDEALARASGRLEKAAIYAPMIIFATHEGRDTDAVTMALESLALFGMRLRRRPGKAAVARRLIRVKYMFARRDTASILAAPDLADPEIRICLETLLALMPPSYGCGDAELFTLAALTAVSLSLEHGNSAGAGFCYTLYGMLIGAAMGQYEAGRRYGELGLALLERYDDLDMSGRSYGTFGSLVHIWTGDLRESTRIMQRAFDLNVRGGNLIHAGYNLFFELQALLHAGLPFPALAEVYERADVFLRRSNDKKVHVGVMAVREMIAVLSGEELEHHHLIAKEFGAPQEVFEDGFATMKSSIAVQRMMVAYVLEDRAAARSAAELSASLIEAGMGAIFEAGHRLFRALIQCDDYRDASLVGRQRLRLSISATVRRLGKWAQSCPETFEHQHALLQGEWARVSGRADDALRAFDRCIKLGGERGFVHHVAIAAERAADACQADGRDTFAHAYLVKAHRAFAQWGAVRKVKLLEARHDSLREEASATSGGPAEASPQLTVTTQTLDATLDLAAVMKASRTLSAEVDLERLLAKLMTIALESAGAQRGFLLQDIDGQPHIQASILDHETDNVQILTRLSVAESSELSHAIVRYVVRTGESLVLHDASAEGRFAQDEYVLRHKPKSVLCSVLRHKDRIAGIMYLENRLASGVFTAQRLELLRAIFAQAAISLENAQLYRRLTAEVQERVAAQAQQRRLLDVLEATPDFVGTADSNGQVLYLNPAGRRLVGGDADDDLSTLALSDCLAPHETERFLAECIPAATREGSWSGEMMLRHADGTEIPTLQVLVAHEARDGGIAYYSMIARDIAEYRQMAERLRQTTKMEAIGQLAGGVAHDFNNLLAGIVGYAELIQRLPESAPPGEYLDGILNACNRATAVTGQLLAFSRRTRVEAVRTDLHEIVENVVGILEHTIDPRIKIVCTLEADNAAIEGDAAQLENAVLNLGINARDAMPTGGTLSFATSIVTDAQATVAHQLGPGRYLELSVRDDGVGMDESVRTHIFEPFFTTKPVGKGTGLGLAAAYGTIENHGGVIDVESAPGQGTVFTILFPVADEHARAPAAPAEAEGDLRGRGRVLLTDDEVLLRDVAARSLKYLGYEVMLAADGREAVTAYREHRDEIDLVILDLHMPTMNGLDALREIRRLDPEARVIVASGYLADDKRAEIMEVGDVGFIQKPYGLADLSRAVVEWIRPPGSTPDAQ